MLKEFKRPMWNDGWSSIRSWNNLYNDYELNHCCFGDGGDGDGSDGTTTDPSQAPDYTGLEDVQGNVSASQAAAAAAAEAAAAADPDMGFDQQSLDNAIDYAERQGSFGYNDLVDIGYFDRKAGLDRQSYAQDELDAIANLSAMGLGVDVNIDPRTGEYSYQAPSFAEAAQAAGMGMMGGVRDLAGFGYDAIRGMTAMSPSNLMASAILGDPESKYQIGAKALGQFGVESPLANPTARGIASLMSGDLLGAFENFSDKVGKDLSDRVDEKFSPEQKAEIQETTKNMTSQEARNFVSDLVDT